MSPVPPKICRKEKNMKTDDNFPFVPFIKAAQLIGCCRSSLEKMCKRKTLTKYYPEGIRKPLIAKAELERIIRVRDHP